MKLDQIVKQAPYSALQYVLRRMAIDPRFARVTSGFPPFVFTAFLEAALAQGVPEEVVRTVRDGVYNACGVPTDDQAREWPKVDNLLALPIAEKVIAGRMDSEPENVRLALNLNIGQQLRATAEVKDLMTEAPYTALAIMVNALCEDGVLTPDILGVIMVGAVVMRVKHEALNALLTRVDQTCGPAVGETTWTRCSPGAALANVTEFLTQHQADEPPHLREAVEKSQALLGTALSHLP